MATPSPMNRGYSSGLAANRRPTTGLAANRAPTTGLAGGAPAGAGFRSSFMGSMAPANRAAPMRAPQPPPVSQAAPAPPPMPAQDPAPDFSNMFPPPNLPVQGQQSFNQQPPSPFDPPAAFKPEPLPTLGQQSFTQQPPSPFGPQPLPYGGARADGGPVQPGRAYMVGERGPEMIVPQQPGMVIPNEAIRSGSLASRPAVPVGGGNRSMAQRRLETAARRGNLRAAQTLFNAEQWGRNMGGQPMMPPPQQRMPMMPPLPAGRQGDRMTRGQGDRMPAPMPPQLMPAAETQQAMPPPMQAPVDLSNMLPPMPMGQMPGGGFNPQAPLPPSTFMGGTGVPPPPQFQVQQVGGWDAFVQNMPDGSQKFLNARNTPEAPVPQPPPLSAAEFGQARAAGFEPVQVGGSYFDAQGVPYLQPLPQPTQKVTVNDDGTVTRSYTEPRGQSPAPAAGVSAPPPVERTTQSGVKVRVSTPGATVMQTGQMPNEAYANPLTPEQSLAAARQEYAATGNDAALRRHFQQFPSEAVRLNQAEGNVWKQIAAQTGMMATEAQMRGQQQADRSAYIDQYSKSPFTQGAIATEYDANFPEQTTLLGQRGMRPDFNLIAQANELNRRAEIAAGRTPPPMMPAYTPAPTPIMPMTQAQRNPGGIMDRLSRLPPIPVPAPTVKRKPRAA